MSTQPVPSDPASPTTGGVRRHHTISAHPRSARAAKEVISEEIHEQQQTIWNDEDQIVDQDWVGGVGAVGEKTSLHRQSSLPTRYHRGLSSSPRSIAVLLADLVSPWIGYQNRSARSGNLTPKTVNSLAAIAGNEGDEEPWKFGSYDVEDDEVTFSTSHLILPS